MRQNGQKRARRKHHILSNVPWTLFQKKYLHFCLAEGSEAAWEGQGKTKQSTQQRRPTASEADYEMTSKNDTNQLKHEQQMTTTKNRKHVIES